MDRTSKKNGDFSVEIRRLISNFGRSKSLLFAWLCAVRALPFLSNKKGLGYWKEINQQIYLRSIFHAIDVAYDIYQTGNNSIYASFSATHATINKNVPLDATVDPATANATAAINAATYAAYAIYAPDFAAYADAYVTKAAFATYLAAVNVVGTIADTDNNYLSEQIKNIIRDDISKVKKGIWNQFNNDTSIYGELWHNFLNGLNETGCNYWANLYSQLFDNNFVFDRSEHQRRLKVPDEIEEKGAAAVGRYLENLGDEVEQLNEARIIILGEKGAGKTSLARKLLDINAKMPKDYESTEGVITSLWKFKDKDGKKDINAHIWDFAGHSITHSAHRCFMSARCLYIYVYRGRIERDNDPEYWLEQIRLHGGNSPVMFLINEQDDHKSDIAKNTLRKEYPSIVDYYHVNIGSKDTCGLEGFCQKVMGLVQDNIAWSSKIISKEAYKIKAELRELFNKEKSPHITRVQFNEIAERNNVTGGRIEDILSNLHALGLCLWYGEEKMKRFNALVLNPDWIADGIYRIINAGHNENKHVVTVDFGAENLSHHKRYKYPRKMVEYLFELMRVYELAFFKEKDRIFIPGILSKDMPCGLPEFSDDDLTMSFEVKKALPPNIVCRVIVQRSDEICDEKLLWRKGAVLKHKDKDATALMKEDGLRIIVDVKGKDKTTYISDLRETMKKTFEEYKGIRPDLKYKILLPDEVKKVLPHTPGQQLPLKFELADTISAFANANTPYAESITERLISLLPTARAYGMIINIGSIHIGNTFIRNEFPNCVINFQGELNSLARELYKKGFEEDAEYVKGIVEDVEEALKIIDDNTPKSQVKETLTKKGLISKMEGFFDRLSDKTSNLYKNTMMLYEGAKIATVVSKAYNVLANAIDLTQIPLM